MTKVIRPQPGPQEQFLASPADIVIYGGGAGGGKTWGLLAEPLRHMHRPRFGGVIFRRNSTQIRNEGGLWDESIEMYLPLGAKPKETTLDWTFSSGAGLSFRHLEHESTKYDWQGAQVAYLGFDELTHFTEGQFWYLVTRNRSLCGIRPYIRATCNPDPDSWVANLIEWWIDQETGFPIPERAGKLRYFVRLGDLMIWADSRGELAEYTMKDEEGNDVPIPAKSLTFIPALVTDNKILMAQDPDYVANLMAQGTVQKARLMGGNWKIRATAGMFKREDVEIVDRHPKLVRVVRAWDLAATEIKNDVANIAATAGVKMGVCENGQYYVLHVARAHLGPSGVVNLIKATAAHDGRTVRGSLPQDPGQAGKAQVQFLLSQLAGLDYRASPESGDKVTRATPFSAQWEAGNVKLMRGPWNEAFLSELEAFPTGQLKDQVDAAGRAFNELVKHTKKKVKTQRRRF